MLPMYVLMVRVLIVLLVKRRSNVLGMDHHVLTMMVIQIYQLSVINFAWMFIIILLYLVSNAKSGYALNIQEQSI